MFQLTIDCADAELLARFWALALDYQLQDPPDGFDTWEAFWRSVGVPEDELGDGVDSIVDPNGAGPRIWFQVVPERKEIKNRLHIDVRASQGRSVSLEIRREQVDAKVDTLLAAGATSLYVHQEPGMDHYAVTMQDPEGNEFCVV